MDKEGVLTKEKPLNEERGAIPTKHPSMPLDEDEEREVNTVGCFSDEY